MNLASMLRGSLPSFTTILVLASLPAQTPLTTVRVATGLARPVWVGAAPGDEDRLFVLEQFTGRIRIIKNGALLPAPILDLRSKILTGTERGLLGLAFHRSYSTNGQFYVNYTRSGDGATIVERYTVSTNNADLADPNSALVILGPITQPRSNHNGGCLQFGPDGYLYIGMGDGGGDPCAAQQPSQWLGKMLRIDVDGGTPYAIPASNPFVNQPSYLPEIWSVGLRNPWRFSFDRANGDLYIGDVGWATREEIVFQSAQSTGGENHGWPIMEGTACTLACPSSPGCNDPSYTLPIHDYPTGPDCAVIGGIVYRGCAIPDLAGAYFFADHCSGRIWSFVFDGTTVTQFTDRTQQLDPPGEPAISQVAAFGEDACGELHLCDLRDGEIYRIVAGLPPAAIDLGYGKPGGNGQQPLLMLCGRLEAGLAAVLTLLDAPTQAAAAVLVSDQNQPTAFPFGTLVPIPALAILGFTTDAEGEIRFTVPGGLGPALLYGQALVIDAGASGGIGVSNALQITFP